MSDFYNISLKRFTLKFTTTHQCSNPKIGRSNSYLTNPSIHNYTTSENFINNKYEVNLQSIDNDWEYYARKMVKNP